MSNEPHGKKPLDVTHKLRYTHLSTGDAQYHDVEKMALVEYTLTNNSTEPIDVLLVSQIVDYSSKQHGTVTLAPGQERTCHQLPMLDEAAINTLDRNTRTAVTASYEYNEKKHRLPDIPLNLLPHNEIIWLMPHPTEAGSSISLFHHIVAWVYDDGDQVVKDAQKAVLEKLKKEEKSPGYPQTLKEHDDEKKKPREQVRAIFHYLKYDKKFSYLYRKDIEGTPRGENEISQSVKRPGDTLRDNDGDCIDIAVLCANLILTIGLDPIIVVKKNHAFVGWKSYSKDAWNLLYSDEKLERQEYEFLDTTWSDDRNKDFDEALKAGKNLYDEILAKNWLAEPPFNGGGFARRLDIKAYREELELSKAKAEFFKVMPPPEAPSPQNDESVTLPGNITQLPVPEIVSNTAQQDHLIASCRYIIEVEKALAPIELEINDHMEGNRCAYILSFLQSISPPHLPKDKNIFSAESKRATKLRLHYKSVEELISSIEALRMRHVNGPASLDPYKAQSSLPGPDILLLHRELVEQTERIAGELKTLLYKDLLHQIEKLANDWQAASLPGKTGEAEAEAS